MLLDYVLIVLKNLWTRKLRSWLTVIGIVIGVSSIVALISISQGLENAILEEFEQFGTDNIAILPKAEGLDPTQSPTLTKEDAEVVARIPEVDYVSPFLMEYMNVKVGKKQERLRIAGIDADVAKKSFEDFGLDLTSGHVFGKNAKFETVLTILPATDVFDRELKVNSRIEINGRKFRIVGVLEEIGNSEDDNIVYIPLETLRDITNKSESLNYINAHLNGGADPEAVAKKIERRLEDSRGDENFQVSTPEQLLEQLNDILSIVQTVLVGIAAISLLVGAVGIMNTVYTSVLERRKEIGVMKSLGARNGVILLVFSMEAGVMGLVGGFFGIIIGVGIAKMTQYGAALAGFKLLKVKADPYLIIGAILFALIVGVVSGTLPAMQAAKLQPVEALRTK